MNSKIALVIFFLGCYPCVWKSILYFETSPSLFWNGDHFQCYWMTFGLFCSRVVVLYLCNWCLVPASSRNVALLSALWHCVHDSFFFLRDDLLLNVLRTKDEKEVQKDITGSIFCASQNFPKLHASVTLCSDCNSIHSHKLSWQTVNQNSMSTQTVTNCNHKLSTSMFHFIPYIDGSNVLTQTVTTCNSTTTISHNSTYLINLLQHKCLI